MLKFSDRQMSLINYYLGRADKTTPIIHGNVVKDVLKNLLHIKKNHTYLISRSDEILSIRHKGVTLEVDYKRCLVSVTRELGNKLQVTSAVYNRSYIQSFYDTNLWKSLTKVEYVSRMNTVRLKVEMDKMINEETPNDTV